MDKARRPIYRRRDCIIGGEDMSRWLFKTTFHGIVVVALLSLIVATWYTWSRAARAAAAPNVGPSSSPTVADQPAAAQAGVGVTAAIRGVRLVVVDQDEVVREVWSNTAGSDYVLMVRLGDRWGADYPATERFMAQYHRVEPTLVRGVTHVR